MPDSFKASKGREFIKIHDRPASAIVDTWLPWGGQPLFMLHCSGMPVDRQFSWNRCAQHQWQPGWHFARRHFAGPCIFCVCGKIHPSLSPEMFDAPPPQCEDIRLWIPEYGYLKTDNHIWISMYRYPVKDLRILISYMDIHIWICICDTHIWVSLYGYPYMDMHTWYP